MLAGGISPWTGCDRKERSVVREFSRQAGVAKEGSEESEFVRPALFLSSDELAPLE